MASVNTGKNFKIPKKSTEEFRKWLEEILKTTPTVHEWLYQSFKKGEKVTARELTRKLVDFPYQNLDDINDLKSEKDSYKEQLKTKGKEYHQLEKEKVELKKQIKALKALQKRPTAIVEERCPSPCLTPPVQRVFTNERAVQLGPQLMDSLANNATLEIHDNDLAGFHILEREHSPVSLSEVGIAPLDPNDDSLHIGVIDALETSGENLEEVQENAPAAAVALALVPEKALNVPETSKNNTEVVPKETAKKPKSKSDVKTRAKATPAKQKMNGRTKAKAGAGFTKKRYKCRLGCVQDYANPSSLSKHMAKKHRPPTKICVICLKPFALLDVLYVHLREVHKIE